MLRQTASGWNDEEHELNDAREPPGGYFYWDTPKIPDPVNAVLVERCRQPGLGGRRRRQQQERPARYGGHLSLPERRRSGRSTRKAPEATRSGFVSVALGGGAACAAPCQSRADTGVGPSVWLRRAITQTEEIGSVGAFVYTGPGVTTGQLAGPRLFPVPWQEEESYYAQRASGGLCGRLRCAGSERPRRQRRRQRRLLRKRLPVGATGCKGSGALGNSYSFEKEGLRVIVLDTSIVQAGERALAPGELEFLKQQLGEAGGHAIVVGNADLPQEYAEGRGAARQLVAAIEEGNAAAYFFDAPEQNVAETLTGAPSSAKAFGSGTLGYVNALERRTERVHRPERILGRRKSRAPKRDKYKRYAVTVRLIPDVEELAVEAEQGTLLRRSQAAAFAGLARRPRAGNRSRNTLTEFEVAPYVSIPDNCVGAGCARGIVPEYRFRSSDPHYGQFVKRNLNSAEHNAVLHDSRGKPISQESEGGKDGLFCAFNATPSGKPVEVILETGNLRYSLPVTIQAGSVRQPCGTTPLAAKPAVAEPSVSPPPVQEPPPSTSSAPTSFTVPRGGCAARAWDTSASATPAGQPVPAPGGAGRLPAGVRAGPAADARAADAAERHLARDLAS